MSKVTESIGSLILVALMFVATPLHAAATAKVAFTDSAAAGLSGTKRVAITSVIVSFQASAGGEKTNTSGMFAARTNASASLQMPDMDTKLLASITDEIYTQLQADLQANGYEVLPEATVSASATYQKIVQMAGITHFSKFADLNGDTLLVGAGNLKPYLPYSLESGKFTTQIKSLIKGWVGTFGKSSTEGGPSNIRSGENYALPGLEVNLAKELNAHLIKATYVITLGSTKAAVDRFSSRTHNSYTGSAFAQVGLLAGQSRIAFRTATANPKGESASGGYMANFGNNAGPAKDGNVVVALGEFLNGGTDFFTVTGGAKPGGLAGFLGVRPGADAQFEFTAAISDPAAYREEVVSMVKLAQREMLTLVKQ